MTIRDVTTRWNFEVEHEKLDRVEKQLEGIHHTLKFLAATEVIRGIVEVSEKFAKFAEELHVAAVSAGLTVEAFQKLSFAAGQSGIESNEMGMAMARLSRHLYEARRGGKEAAQAFAEAGFTTDQVAGFRTSKDVLLALADRFHNIQDPIQKSALAMQLMGRSSVRMVGFLSQGPGAISNLGDEAERLGLILSKQQVESLVRIEHALQKLWGVVKAFSAGIASLFGPSIESAINKMLKFYEVNRKVIDLNVRAWVWDITYAMGAVWAVIKFVTQAVIDFVSAHQLLVRRVLEVILVIGSLVATIFVLKTAFGRLTSILSPSFLILKYLGMALWWIATTALPALLPVLAAVGTLFADLFLALTASPLGILAALIVLLHDAYTLLFGSGKWEDTWLGKAFGAIKGIGGSVLGGVENILGIGSAAKEAPGASTSSTISSNSTNTIAPQITFNVPAGSDPQSLYKAVQSGIKDALGTTWRETNRSLTPQMHY